VILLVRSDWLLNSPRDPTFRSFSDGRIGLMVGREAPSAVCWLGQSERCACSCGVVVPGDRSWSSGQFHFLGKEALERSLRFERTPTPLPWRYPSAGSGHQRVG